ncbi:hypothetical protein [Streptosporangium vulgare]|uniref:hypothetical protein n=1 Tax=Streptosporangium vulgare TaxID=46190 RepID=UPI0031D6FD2C
MAAWRCAECRLAFYADAWRAWAILVDRADEGNDVFNLGPRGCASGGAVRHRGPVVRARPGRGRLDDGRQPAHGQRGRAGGGLARRLAGARIGGRRPGRG